MAITKKKRFVSHLSVSCESVGRSGPPPQKMIIQSACVNPQAARWRGPQSFVPSLLSRFLEPQVTQAPHLSAEYACVRVHPLQISPREKGDKSAR